MVLTVLVFFDRVTEDWNYQPIVSWNNLVKNISWGALMLLGAGLSVATAFRVI